MEKKHKSNCSINIRCAVFHEDGVCNHQTYGKCDCGVEEKPTPTNTGEKSVIGVDYGLGTPPSEERESKYSKYVDNDLRAHHFYGDIETGEGGRWYLCAIDNPVDGERIADYVNYLAKIIATEVGYKRFHEKWADKNPLNKPHPRHANVETKPQPSTDDSSSKDDHLKTLTEFQTKHNFNLSDEALKNGRINNLPEWEKEFDERFVNRNGNFNTKSSMEAVKSFIHKTLTQQRERIVREVEDLRKPKRYWSWPWWSEEDIAFNQGIDAVLSKLSLTGDKTNGV